jgi:hypothetical protein
LSSRIRLLIEDMLAAWQALDERIAAFDAEFAAEAKRNESASALFLASDEANFINGFALPVDGRARPHQLRRSGPSPIHGSRGSLFLRRPARVTETPHLPTKVENSTIGLSWPQ